jgi:hypothetical protein
MAKVTVFAMIAYDSENMQDFGPVIQSLNNCQPPPTAIGIVGCSHLPTSLRKKNRLTIYKVAGLNTIKPLDVFRLPKLMMADHTGLDAGSIYCLVVTPNNTYPVHIIEEYLNWVPRIQTQLKNKADSGLICGLTGIKITLDKKKQMDGELAALAAGMPVPDPSSFMTNSYTIENTPVDILTFGGSLFYHYNSVNLQQLTSDNEKDCAIVLSEYCKKHNICLFQISTLTLNRLMFERMRMFRSHTFSPDAARQ